MQKIVVKNCETAAGSVQGSGDNEFTVKPVIDDLAKCSANFVEVAPQKTAYGYHYHEENEEVFYIIRGEASVKTPDGDIRLKQGDAIAFPANVNGSHVISNPSKTETLLYLDFGTANKPDIVHFTGTENGLIVTRDGVKPF